jgi:hypothetical protein
MHRAFVSGALLLVMLSNGAEAGQAEICYTTPVPVGVPNPPPTNSTVFHCPTAGDKTLPQLAALAWEVVQLTPLMTPGANPQFGDYTQQLIVQKP